MRRKHRHKRHHNPNGNVCHCPWGQGVAEPYSPPEAMEAVGSISITSMWHTSSKLEWLMDRPDMQDEKSKEFLNDIDYNFPEHDALYPWLVREWKQGRLFPDSFKPPGQYQDKMPFTYKKENGHNEGLESADLTMLNNWMKYQKQNKQGVDIMKHNISHVLPEASKWDAGGETVWNGDDDETYEGNGLKVVHLRNKRDLRVEGRRMNHCIGSNGQDYHKSLENGVGLYYSIRDSDNEPYGTLEFEKKQDDYFKCPSCKKFVAGEEDYKDGLGYITKCENCGHTLEVPAEAARTQFNTNLTKGTTKHPVNLAKMAKNPDARFVSPKQFYGHEDETVPPDVVDAANHYFSKFGHPWIDSSESHNNDDDDEEEQPTLENLGYQNEYEHDPPENLDQLRNFHNDETSLAPQEYHDAIVAADENNLEYPRLSMDGEIDWDDILENLNKESSKTKVDPNRIKELWKIAAYLGKEHKSDLNDAAKRWLKTEYDAFLDPYGKENGPGQIGFGGYNSPVNHIGPKDDKGFPLPAPHLPATNYPGIVYPHEEYFARNLMHHLERTEPRDPQTGLLIDPEYDYKQLNPGLTPPSNLISPEPRFPFPVTPIPEQTGPYTIGPDSRLVQHEFPYGREGEGEREWINPGRDRPVDQYALEGMRAYDRPVYPREEPETMWHTHPQGVPTYDPTSYFTPGEEDIRTHQRAFPGMEFTDENIPQRAWNPNEPYNYDKGQQQGNLFPSKWYIDYEKNEAKKTELPEHLFQPEHYGFHDPMASEVPLWNNIDSGPWEGQSRTFTLPFDQRVKRLEQTGEDPAFGNWVAKTKEAGPWTDYEQERQVKRGPFSDFVEPHQGDVYNNGSVVQFAPQTTEGKEPWYFTMPGFEWRVPTLYHHPTGRMYVGKEGMEHGDLARQFSLPKPWNENLGPAHEIHPGYIDTKGVQDTGPGMYWYGEFKPQNHPELEQWAEDQYGVRARPPKFQTTPQDVWSDD